MNERRRGDTSHWISLWNTDGDVVDLKMDVQAEVEWNEERERLHRAISRLSHEQQVLLDEVYFQYVPQKEIAKREKVSEAAISARITRILSKLKKYLQ